VIAHILVSLTQQPSLGSAVFAIGAIAPEKELADVKRNLRKRYVAGKVLFDFLLTYDDNICRYFRLPLMGSHSRGPVFKPEPTAISSLLRCQFNLSKEYAEEVCPSLPSPAMQYALLAQLPL